MRIVCQIVGQIVDDGFLNAVNGRVGLQNRFDGRLVFLQINLGDGVFGHAIDEAEQAARNRRDDEQGDDHIN